MLEVPISEFRAQCVAILEQVRKTQQPIRVTRYGKPGAEIVPVAPKFSRKDWIRVDEKLRQNY
jgi:prevent-host-death family protein